MTARYHCRHTFAWDAHWSKAAPVLIEATEQADVVTVNGERFEVVEVIHRPGDGVHRGCATRASFAQPTCATVKTTPEEAATSTRGLTTSTNPDESKEGL